MYNHCQKILHHSALCTELDGAKFLALTVLFSDHDFYDFTYLIKVVA